MKFREWLFRCWYWYVNKRDKNAEILFMNYGYEDHNQTIKLDKEDEQNRYSIQLYHHLVSMVDITGKDILEIGSGRGGGLAYTAKTFQPSSARGVDRDKIATRFCNEHYGHMGLSFIRGDAQNLPLEDNTFDVILNVESSHRYPDMNSFLGEVKRLLKPKGYFLYTDFRYETEMEQLKQQLKASGLTLLTEQEITPSVQNALDKDDARRRELVKRLTPKIVHKAAFNFAGAVSSPTYNQFANRQYIYYSYVFQKN